MKNLLVAIGLLTSSVAYGQEQQQNNTKWFMVKQECKPVEEFMAQVVGGWGEHALFSAKGVTIGVDDMPYNGGVMLFVNQQTGTWTLGTLYSNGMVCISAAGTEFVPYSG